MDIYIKTRRVTENQDDLSRKLNGIINSELELLDCSSVKRERSDVESNHSFEGEKNSSPLPHISMKIAESFF